MVDERLQTVRQILPDEMDELVEGSYRRRRPAADVLPLPEDEGPSFNQLIEAEEDVVEARSLAQDLESLQKIDPSFVTDPVKLYLREIAHAALLNHQQEIDLAKRIENAQDAEKQLREADEQSRQGRTLLSDVERQHLERQREDGLIATQTFVRSNLRLVVSIAKKYVGRGLSLLDLIQEGNLGLIRAVQKYDWNTGFRFSTYATWWIRQAITRAIADQSRTIRLPVHMGDAVSRFRGTVQELNQTLGRRPKVEEIAEAMSVPTEKVEQIMSAAQRTLSLETPVGEEDEARLGDLIADEGATSPEQAASEGLLREDVAAVLKLLTERERLVLRLRFGLDDGHQHTLAEVGEALGISRERVRQIEGQALHKLRGTDIRSRLLAYHSEG